jgi:hypothetical protein
MKRGWLLLLVVMMLPPGCADSPSEPNVAENELVFTRANGSAVTFPAGAKSVAWCGPWDAELDLEMPTLHIFFGTPQPAAYWSLSAVRADVRIGQPLAFPNSFVFNQPRNASLFVLDPPNEVSSAEGGSSGSITFEELNCALGGQVRFTIDAMLGSEFSDGAPIRVQGSFRGTIEPPPR